MEQAKYTSYRKFLLTRAARQAGYSSTREYNCRLRELRAKNQGFDSVAEYQQHLKDKKAE